MNALDFQAMTERKFEELNNFKEVTEQQIAQLTRELDELKGLIRGKLEQREEQEEAAGEHQELRSVDDIQASTGHKRPLLKKIRGIFRSTKKKKGFYEPPTQEESSLSNGDQIARRVPDKSRLQRFRALQNEGFVSSPSTQSPSTLSINSTDDIQGLDDPVSQITEYSRRRTNSSKENGEDLPITDVLTFNRKATMTEDSRTSYVRRHNGGETSRRGFDTEEFWTDRRDVIRHDSTRSQISFDIEEDRTNTRDVRRHDSTRSQISFDAYDARAGRRDVRRHDSTRSQISLVITAFSSPRTYSNQSLPVVSQEKFEHPVEIQGCLKKTRSLQETEYISDVDLYEPPESIIKEHPSDRQTQKEGLRVEFKCLGQENRKVTYQWYKDGIPLGGRKSSLLVLDPVKLLDFGCYECRVRCRDSQEYSHPATLDVIPQDGMRLQLLNEVFEHSLETRETVEKLLVTEVPGLGGWKQVAHKYKMKKVDIDVLQGRQDAGATVISSIIAHIPELTVYDFCKTVKKSNIRRLDIVKELRGHLSVPKE